MLREGTVSAAVGILLFKSPTVAYPGDGEKAAYEAAINPTQGWPTEQKTLEIIVSGTPETALDNGRGCAGVSV